MDTGMERNHGISFFLRDPYPCEKSVGFTYLVLLQSPDPSPPRRGHLSAACAEVIEAHARIEAVRDLVGCVRNSVDEARGQMGGSTGVIAQIHHCCDAVPRNQRTGDDGDGISNRKSEDGKTGVELHDEKIVIFRSIPGPVSIKLEAVQ